MVCYLNGGLNTKLFYSVIIFTNLNVFLASVGYCLRDLGVHMSSHYFMFTMNFSITLIFSLIYGQPRIILAYGIADNLSTIFLLSK